MRKKNKKQDGLTGVKMTSEALHLLRVAPLNILACYYIGTLPFLLLFLYFCSDMSRGAFGHEHCIPLSLALVLAFFWMKSWQAVFMSRLSAHVSGFSEPKWSMKRISRLTLTQCIIHPLGLLAIPLGILIMIPFGYIYAYYQNMLVLGDGGDEGIKDVSARAWKMALLWPRQNHLVMWVVNPWVLGLGVLFLFGSIWIMTSMVPLFMYIESGGMFLAMIFIMLYVSIFTLLILAPFGCVVFVNIAMVLALVPVLIHKLLGIESVFVLSGMHALMNTTFIISVFGLSCMVLDPLSKAAYVLRCFYGESLSSGHDLLTELSEVQS